MSNRPPTLDSMARGTYRDDHGTPEWLIETVREVFTSNLEDDPVLPEITLDLASDDEAQKIIKAKRYYTRENPCPNLPEVGDNELIWCNPPGPAKNVVRFFKIWLHYVVVGPHFSSRSTYNRHGAFLVYSVDHLRMLELDRGALYVCFIRDRIKFEGNSGSATIGSALITTHHPIRELPRHLGVWLLWRHL